MNLNLWGVVVSFVFVFLILFASRYMSRFGIEASRKFVHIVLANWWIIAMVFFDSALFAAIVPFVFIILNFLSYRYGIFKTVERGGGKEDLGTVYYAISLFILALVSFQRADLAYLGAVGIFAMGYGDGFAAVVGRATNVVPFQIFRSQKSLGGSLAMFVATFLSVFVLLVVVGVPSALLAALLVGLVAMSIELLTPFGLDNLTVPLLTTAFYYLVFVL